MDDHDLIRLAVSSALGAVEGIQVIGACKDGADAVEICERARPDVVVMDLFMAGMGGIEATGRVLAAQPECRVVIHTAAAPGPEIRDAMAAGAATCVFKDVGLAALIGAVRGAPIAAPPVLGEQKA